MAALLQLLIKLYQAVISPWLGSNCIYQPTCSHYMAQAITKHGAVKGVLLGLRRISRCHPFAQGGYDPVPENFSFNKTKHE